MLFGGYLGLSSLSLIDLYFIEKLGDQALTAVGISTPIVLLVLSGILSINTGIVATLSPFAGLRNVGDKLYSNYVVSSLFLGASLGIIFSLLFLFFTLFLLDYLKFTSSEGTSQLLKAYLFPFGFFWFPFALLVSAIGVFRAEGNTIVPLKIVIIVVVINLVLDPILMFYGLGIGPLHLKGAAWASFVAVTAGCLFSIYKLNCEFGILRMKKLVLKPAFLQKVFAISIPVFLTRVLLPLSSLVIVALLAKEGEAVLAAYGIGYRIDTCIMLFGMALSASLMPLIGQNLGVKNHIRLKYSVRVAIYIGLAYAILILLLIQLYVQFGIRLEPHSPEYLFPLKDYFLILSFSYPFLTLLMLINTSLNVLRKSVWALLLSIFQLFVLMIPFAYIMRSVYGFNGVFLAIPLSGGLTVCLGFYLLFLAYDEFEE